MLCSYIYIINNFLEKEIAYGSMVAMDYRKGLEGLEFGSNCHRKAHGLAGHLPISQQSYSPPHCFAQFIAS